VSIEVRSLFRRVQLRSPAADGWTDQALLVPAGATDEQVLAWAAELLSGAAVVELREVLEREATPPPGRKLEP
jgi:hypothetical protein